MSPRRVTWLKRTKTNRWHANPASHTFAPSELRCSCRGPLQYCRKVPSKFTHQILPALFCNKVTPSITTVTQWRSCSKHVCYIYRMSDIYEPIKAITHYGHRSKAIKALSASEKKAGAAYMRVYRARKKMTWCLFPMLAILHQSLPMLAGCETRYTRSYLNFMPI